MKIQTKYRQNFHEVDYTGSGVGMFLRDPQVTAMLPN